MPGGHYAASPRVGVTAGQHSFAQVPSAEIQRSVFDRSCNHKTTFDAGLLIPIYVDEVLPGDTFNLRMATFGRMATPLHPIMDNLKVAYFFFFCPNRLLWDNWVKMMGEQVNPSDSTDFLVPKMTSPAGGYGELSLHDYFGLPTKIAGFDHSALWHRMYNRVYQEFFKDQNLQTAPVLKTDDGPDNPADYTLRRRCKRPDYFTSCLPFPQKGPAVDLPLGSQAPLSLQLKPHGTAAPTFVATTNATANTPSLKQKADADQTVEWSLDATTNAAGSTMRWQNPQLFLTDATGVIGTAPFADLSTATAATINQLREAFQIQRLYERDARGGTRYVEQLLSHFGVRSPDFRLQRPEFLGGGIAFLNMNPVAAVSTSTGSKPVGELGAFVTTSSNGHGFVKSFTEHGLIMGLACVYADLNYQEGLDRMWTRGVAGGRFEFYWPALAHLGEQAVYNREIFCQGTAADAQVFGYQERWAEYRYKPSKVTGLMRSNAAASLDTWHLAQDFTALPVLNDSFIVENPPVSRVIAVPSEPQFIMDMYFSVRTARPMPTFSVPGLIDHF